MTLPGQFPYREFGRPRSSQGFWDFDAVVIPVHPQRLVLTDRADGQTLWLLGVTSGGALQLTAPTLPLATDITVYAPLEGPVTNNARLFVNAGVLKAEPAPSGVSDPPVILNVQSDTSRLGIVSVAAGAVTLTVIPRP